jgi:Cdc6-like AAA superfamily ATPase
LLIFSHLVSKGHQAQEYILITSHKVQQGVNEISGDVKDTKSTVQDISLGQRQAEIEKWLSPPDPSTNYNEALKQRQEGTGLWLLHTPAYINWKIEQPSALWLHGIPGCGKTILSSTIVQDAKSTLPSGTILYFYFDFNDNHKQTFDSMIRSLISQLCCQSEDAWKRLSSFFLSCAGGRRQPSTASLCQLFFQMIDDLEYVYIVLDALDECTTRMEPCSEGLLYWISDLMGSGRTNIRLLVTSRPEEDIESTLSGLIDKEHIVPIQSNLISSDISTYICTRVRKGEGLKRWQKYPDVQQKIEETLIRKADGM